MFRKCAHSVEIPMDHVTRMEVVEAFGDIR